MFVYMNVSQNKTPICAGSVAKWTMWILCKLGQDHLELFFSGLRATTTPMWGSSVDPTTGLLSSWWHIHSGSGKYQHCRSGCAGLYYFFCLKTPSLLDHRHMASADLGSAHPFLALKYRGGLQRPFDSITAVFQALEKCL